MKVRVGNLMAAVMLLLLAATVVLWIKSYWISDTLCWDRGLSADPHVRRTQWGVQSRQGRMVIGHLSYLPKAIAWRMGPMSSDCADSIRYLARAVPLDWIGATTQLERVGFSYRHTLSGVFGSIVNAGEMDELTITTFPHWALIIVLSLWPAIWLPRRLRLRGRKRLGLCLNCGYDLHGIESARCPECGTSVDSSPSR